MRIGLGVGAILMVLLLTACGEEPSQSEKSSSESKTAVVEAVSVTSEGGFDIGKVAVSTADLGAFPYFARPQGISAMGGEKTLDLGRFPFWTGGKFETIEGRIFMGGLQAEEGKSYSKLVMQKYIEDRVTDTGGVKVGEGRIPTAASDQLGDDVKVGMILGLGDIYNDPTATYVIKRADSTIWIHFVSNDLFGSWTIAERKSP